MRSRLLVDLEKQSLNTKNRVAWSRVMCRIAIHHARQGSPTIANDYIQKVRKHYGVELQHEVASWVMLAEGILHFSKAEMDKAYDRLRRAYGLAVAFKTESARPTCAAWMALLEFNAGKYELMIPHLEEAFNTATQDDHQALGRACLVLADALQLSGSFELARPYYEESRIHATKEGDQATLSAYLYNVAAFRAANLRLADAFDEVDANDLRRASMEANSSFTYDMAVGSLAFGNLWKILHAQLLVIRGEFSEAKLLLEAAPEEQLVKRDIPLVLIDLAWCLLNLGQLFDAEKLYRRSLDKRNALTEPDDLAYFLSRAGRIARHLNLGAESDELFREAKEHYGTHKAIQDSLRSKLIPLLEVIGTKKSPAAKPGLP